MSLYNTLNKEIQLYMKAASVIFAKIYIDKYQLYQMPFKQGGKHNEIIN